MAKNVNLEVGKNYGMLTILSFSHSDKEYQRYYNVRCKCGVEKVVRLNIIKSGNTKSCGCLQKEIVRLLGLSCKTHGGTGTSEYTIWKGIKNRCYNTKIYEYRFYGALGVKMCERWLNSFQNFIDDVGMRPSKEYSLDRFPNKYGDYEPGNVRWATIHEQTRNRKSNIFLTFMGEEMILTDFCKKVNIPFSTVSKYVRINGIDKALTFYIKKYESINDDHVGLGLRKSSVLC